MMLDDGDYLDGIQSMIEGEKVGAEYAVDQTGEQYAQIFASMDDEYMQARSADILDISRRLIRVLAGLADESLEYDEPLIIRAAYQRICQCWRCI